MRHCDKIKKRENQKSIRRITKVIMMVQKISNLLYDFITDLQAGIPTSKLVEIYTDKIIRVFREETSDQKPS
ncbi:hypothetical protein DQM28_10140 [Leptospira mayottensis]|nr:hypothetical protein DQM28_10140 [Leptospira mayottensis]